MHFTFVLEYSVTTVKVNWSWQYLKEISAIKTVIEFIKLTINRSCGANLQNWFCFEVPLEKRIKENFIAWTRRANLGCDVHFRMRNGTDMTERLSSAAKFPPFVTFWKERYVVNDGQRKPMKCAVYWTMFWTRRLWMRYSHSQSCFQFGPKYK